MNVKLRAEVMLDENKIVFGYEKQLQIIPRFKDLRKSCQIMQVQNSCLGSTDLHITATPNIT